MEKFYRGLSATKTVLYLSDRFLSTSVVDVQLLSRVRLFATPWAATRQASLSFTVSWSLLKLMFTESVMPSKHLILCHAFLLLPSISPLWTL